MGSGSKGQTTQAQTQESAPGTLSPITATLLSLFGGAPQVRGGQFQPTAFAGPGALFTPESFSALPGLLANQPLTPVESFLTGGSIQGPALAAALQGQGLLQQAAGAVPALLETEPTAAIAAARRGFTEETIPAILERAPGFSSSDLQRELARAGTDLELGVAALREANLGRVGATVAQLPQFTQALGTNLLDQASQILGYGQLGRELVRETSPAGDAFRVLVALQSLTGPGITQFQTGTGTTRQRSKSTGVFA